mgnify:CR=1 FL=1
MNETLDILLAEDSQTQALRFKLTLESRGYRVTIAKNGIEAMNLLMEHPVSIVISDWVMPEMDGLELCQAIRRHDFENYVYIILLTAKDAKHDIIKGLEAGADDYLVKPVDDAELIARLSTARRIISLEASLKQRNQEIALLSITDPLTRVFNRGYLNAHLPKVLKRALRYQHPLSLLITDIDHFKEVNDHYGHQAGDQVLKAFTENLAGALRRDLDWIARYGGEEFIIVLPETDYSGAEAVAERLRCMTEDMTIRTHCGDIRIKASFGIVSLLSHSIDSGASTDALALQPAGPDILTAENVIDRADQCLYRAKQAGRNCCMGVVL